MQRSGDQKMATVERKFRGVKTLCWSTLVMLFMLNTGGAWAQDIVNGEKVFKKCAACHTVGKGAKNKVGPVLNGVVGRPAAQASGFKYSKAMRDSGITWDEATLAAYLGNPKTTVKGTRMIFGGLKKDTDIADVIAYLKGYGPDGTKR